MSYQTWTRCTKITRTDGVELGFTELDRDISIGGLIYKANSATEPKAIKTSVDLGADKLEVQSILDSDNVTESDIIGGKYREAKVISARIDYRNPPNSLSEGTVLLSGVIGEITTTDTTYTMEVRTLIATLNQGVSVKASPQCRWAFGSPECFHSGSNTTDFAPLTVNSSVSNSVSRRQFEVDQPPGFSAKHGFVEFTSGQNKGLIITIKNHDAGSPTIELLRSLPFNIGNDDSVTIKAGCAKTAEACKAYGNFINFGGFPPPTSEASGWIPGSDEIIAPTINS